MSNIAKSAPSAVVIGFQVFDEATAVRVYKAGKRLVQDLRYSSAMLYSHDVSISVVLIRDDKELDLFEEKVWNGYFHGSSIRWAGVVEAAGIAVDIEADVDGKGRGYPHIMGPLPVSAVVRLRRTKWIGREFVVVA